MRAQQPLTEKVLEFNMSFHNYAKLFFFMKHRNKTILALNILNSRTWKTLKSTIVILQALETSPTSVASATSLASTASKAQFPQKNIPFLMNQIITGTKITNTGNFFGNGSSKI